MSNNNQNTTVIGQSDFTGDVTFFDNRFCFVSPEPEYLRTTINPKSNEIVAHRLLNYQSPDRQSYIYMKRTNAKEDCSICVELCINEITHPGDFKHRHLKMEGDFKSDTLQEVCFFVTDTNSTPSCVDSSFKLLGDGTVEAGGSKYIAPVNEGEWFHLLWTLNLDTKKFDVYINGQKIVADVDINPCFEQFNIFSLSLSQVCETGDLYIDNFDVTGLIKPIVDGVETKTTVLPATDAVEKFLEDKIALHAYGNILCKNGVKSELSTKGIYDFKLQEYFASVDTLSQVFDLDFADNGREITGDITIKKDGSVICKDGKKFQLSSAPRVENGKMYVPIKQIGTHALGKFLWSFPTGIIIFSDYEFSLNTDSWIWFSMRDTSSASGCMRWNDIDHLNAYLQYVRPSIDRLKEDYIKTTNDTTLCAHPRLYYTEDEFKMQRELYKSGKDPVFNKMTDHVIENAIWRITENMASYKNWGDPMRHSAPSMMEGNFHHWGYAYYITGDKRFVDAAWEQFKHASECPDFNTAHVIDAGTWALALAVGYDWFYNAFTPEQRKLALDTTKRCLYELGSGLYGRITSASNGAMEWRSFKVMSNYNTIVNAGIIMAAIATLEDDTENTLRLLKDSARSIEYTCQMLPPGGAWTEGPAYLAYALRYFLPAMLNLERNFGTSYNLMDGQGMESMLDFFVANTGPCGMNNQGDADHLLNRSFAPYFYLAKRYGKPHGSYIRYNDIKTDNAKGDVYDLRFYDFDAVNMTEDSLKNVNKAQYIPGNELFAIRDTYDMDNSKFYFAAHFGTTIGYHQQYDCSTFVLDMNGKRWAHDLGRDNYSLQNELGYKTHEMYRKRAEAHNMMTINPRKYTNGSELSVKGGEFAPVLDSASNEFGGYVYADMSQVYPDATKATTGYYIDNMTDVIVRNEFTVEEDAEVVWNLITKGDIEIADNVAYITQDGSAIKLEFITSGENARWVDNGTPKPYPETVCPEKFKKQLQNEEFSQLRLVMDVSAGFNKFVVRITPKDKVNMPIEDKTFSQWNLPKES